MLSFPVSILLYYVRNGVSRPYGGAERNDTKVDNED